MRLQIARSKKNWLKHFILTLKMTQPQMLYMSYYIDYSKLIQTVLNHSKVNNTLQIYYCNPMLLILHDQHCVLYKMSHPPQKPVDISDSWWIFCTVQNGMDHMIHFRKNVLEKKCHNTSSFLVFTIRIMPKEDSCWRPNRRLFTENRKFSPKLTIKLNL